jgi:hypothetical protein
VLSSDRRRVGTAGNNCHPSDLDRSEWSRRRAGFRATRRPWTHAVHSLPTRWSVSTIVKHYSCAGSALQTGQRVAFNRRREMAVSPRHGSFTSRSW